MEGSKYRTMNFTFIMFLLLFTVYKLFSMEQFLLFPSISWAESASLLFPLTFTFTFCTQGPRGSRLLPCALSVPDGGGSQALSFHILIFPNTVFDCKMYARAKRLLVLFTYKQASSVCFFFFFNVLFCNLSADAASLLFSVNERRTFPPTQQLGKGKEKSLSAQQFFEMR